MCRCDSNVLVRQQCIGVTVLRRPAAMQGAGMMGEFKQGRESRPLYEGEIGAGKGEQAPI